MLRRDQPAIILAPMDGLSDAPMRAVQGRIGAFSFAVSEFLRISADVLSEKALLREVPELLSDGNTPTGLPVQVQLLGGDPERMAQSAIIACDAGAQGIDINFGCPAPTVNRHDGGATLLKHPQRIRQIVSAVRAAVPPPIPVSAKLRLGWDDVDSIYENAEMAAEGGVSWLTIHGRTRVQGYRPPAIWEPIGRVRERLGGLPVVANGDINTIEAFRRCREATGCSHFMLGRGGIANPALSHQVARELNVPAGSLAQALHGPIDWAANLSLLAQYTAEIQGDIPRKAVCRLKQWLKIAENYGMFDDFDRIKTIQSPNDLISALSLGVQAARPGFLPIDHAPSALDVAA